MEAMQFNSSSEFTTNLILNTINKIKTNTEYLGITGTLVYPLKDFTLVQYDSVLLNLQKHFEHVNNCLEVSKGLNIKIIME